jgi:hypothetical protein
MAPIPLNLAELPEFTAEPEAASGRRRNSNYHSSLVSLMSYTLGQQFESTQFFGVDALRSLTPYHIVRWMNNKAYGRPDPDYERDKPTGCRASTIEYMKILSRGSCLIISSGPPPLILPLAIQPSQGKCFNYWLTCEGRKSKDKEQHHKAAATSLCRSSAK